MKKFYTLLIALSFLTISKLLAASDTIISVEYTFAPAELTINVWDTVVFDLGSIHNAVEVSESNWIANNGTSNGGFDVPYGGGTVTFNTPGIYYYVCQAHIGFGMKGVIIVLAKFFHHW